MTETEVKIRIDDPKSFRVKALGLGAVLARERHLEEDTFFDFDPPRLREKGLTLRVRAAGRQATLTFKGEKRKSRSFKVRQEFETQVRDPRALRKILKSLGLREGFSYRKRRTVLRKSRLTITIDETPAGDYVELEGERHEIVRFARALGFKRADFITRGYVELIEEMRRTAAPDAPPAGRP
jgi:predicted adenylyl cyclase CyaB